MKIRVWTAIIDQGDGSSSSKNYPTEEALRKDLNLDDEDFECDEDGEVFGNFPVEITSGVMDITGYETVE